MDWTTLLVSGLSSAVVSAIVALVVAPRMKVLQMRAEAREVAAQEVAAIAREHQLEILRHKDSGNEGVREPDRFVSDDVVQAHRLTEAARGLGCIRRWFVHRRLVRLFGPFTVERARLMKGLSGDEVFAALIGPLMTKDGTVDLMRDGTGSIHAALMARGGSPQIEECLKDLRRLEKRLW